MAADAAANMKHLRNASVPQTGILYIIGIIIRYRFLEWSVEIVRGAWKICSTKQAAVLRLLISPKRQQKSI